MSSHEKDGRSADAERAGHGEAPRAVRVRSDPVHRNAPMRSTSGISSSTTSSIPARRARASASRPSPAPCATSCRSAGCARRRRTSARIPSASTTCRWSSSSAARWPTTSRTCCSIRVVQRVVAEKGLDWLGVLEQEPDAGLGNGGLGRLAACFLDSMATMQLPAMGYGLRYEYGIFKQTIQDGWQQRAARQLAAPAGPVGGRPPAREGGGQAELLLRGARRRPCSAIVGRPSSLIGIPFDRPVVGYGGKTINTLRLWAAAAPDYFDFQEFSGGDFVERAGREARRRIPHAGPVSRRLHEHGAGTAVRAGVFPRRLLAGRPRAALPAQQRRLERAPREGRHPAQRHAPGAGRPRADAHPARRGAPRLGRGLGPHPADARLHEPHAAARGAGEVAAAPGSRCCCRAIWRSSYEINRRLLDEVRARFPGDERPGRAREPDRGGPASARSAWPTSPSSARTAPTAWPPFTPSCCAR